MTGREGDRLGFLRGPSLAGPKIPSSSRTAGAAACENTISVTTSAAIGALQVLNMQRRLGIALRWTPWPTKKSTTPSTSGSRCSDCRQQLGLSHVTRRSRWSRRRSGVDVFALAVAATRTRSTLALASVCGSRLPHWRWPGRPGSGQSCLRLGRFEGHWLTRHRELTRAPNAGHAQSVKRRDLFPEKTTRGPLFLRRSEPNQDRVLADAKGMLRYRCQRRVNLTDLAGLIWQR